LIEKESLKISELEQTLANKAVNFLKDLLQLLIQRIILIFVPLQSVVAPRTGRSRGSAYGCSSPALGKLLRAILATEQKLAWEVLGVKGANRWRGSGLQAAKSRWERETCVFANQPIKRYSG
jgi:hypothetical protein